MIVIQEADFRARLYWCLEHYLPGGFAFVTGPGRSGAIAAAYVSHFLGIPFVPYGQFGPMRRALIVDTASASGKTLRKAMKHYKDWDPLAMAFYPEPPRVAF